MIDLYYWPTPCGWKVSIMLEELGLPYEVHAIDLSKNVQKEPWFLAINPNGRIPAIVDRDFTPPLAVFESGAIMIHLAEKTGSFWPSEPAAHVATMEWLMFQMGGFGPIPGQVHHFIALDDESDRRYGLERFMDETRRLYAVMDRRLGEYEFFAGAEISIADFAIVGWAWRHPRHQVDLADFPHVQRWYRVMMARPGVARGFAVPLRRG